MTTKVTVEVPNCADYDVALEFSGQPPQFLHPGEYYEGVIYKGRSVIISEVTRNNEI